MAKRDFLFIDETGDPGAATEYYIQGLIHLTDESLKEINLQLGAMRFFGTIRNELKSTRLNKNQKDLLHSIIKHSLNDSVFVKATVIVITKADYVGPYLEDKTVDGVSYPKDAKKFRHFVLRRLLEQHFAHTTIQSQEVELVIDRFHSSEIDEKLMRSYLRIDKHNRLPYFAQIIQADSRYVELLQVADWVTGVVKESRFTHTERDHQELLDNIRVYDVRR